METALQYMGILGLMDPITARDLRDRMELAGAQGVTVDTVSLLWEGYQEAVLKKGLPPFYRDAEWIETFNYLIRVTEFPKMVVSAFLTALRAQAQAIGSNEYLDPRKGQAAQADAKELVKDTIQAPAKLFQTAAAPVIETTADAGKAIVAPLKWAAVGLAGLAVLYLSYNVFTTFRPALKAAGKRKG